jgi:hypothetical protein
METKFCLRVDIDTWEGLQKGLPECTRISDKNSFPITYYLSLGKYSTGRNLFRILRKKEPIKKGIPVWQRNHWKDIFRGILLPAKKIGKNTIQMLLDFEASEFTEIHPHGYNHVHWSNSFIEFNEAETANYMDRMITEYTRIFRKEPRANAAPNFSVNAYYLSLLPSKHFEFASDFIYSKPFSLSLDGSDGAKTSIVQLPVTEETIEKLLVQGKTKSEIVQFYKRSFQQHINNGSNYICLYIHAIFEPLKFQSLLEEIINLTYQLDMQPMTHSTFFERTKKYPTLNIKEIHQEV